MPSRNTVSITAPVPEGSFTPHTDHYWANTAVTTMASSILIVSVIIPPIVSVILASSTCTHSNSIYGTSV